MLMMIKHEFRKNLKTIATFLIGLAVVEFFFAFNMFRENEGGSIGMIVIAFMIAGLSYAVTLVSGILSYYNDLRRKEGYLTFMTPVSTYTIVGAKVIVSFLTGILLAAISCVAGFVSWEIACDKYNWTSIIKILKMLLEDLEIDLDEVVLVIVIIVVYLMTQLLMYIGEAYFAISLCFTFFSNQKHKGVLSFALYIAVSICVNLVASLIGFGIDLDTVDESSQVLLAAAPVEALYFLLAIFFFVGTGWLLKKKISL